MKNISSNKTLVIGAGIAGINAALKLAEAGKEVILCERSPYIGGTLFRLDKWFPNDHCGMCQSLPILDDRNGTAYCLRKGLFHPNINVLVNSQVK
ncbi:MAG: FAD-dependent oxidoreductase, partial [Dehalococcoidales bacterium]|nr:FAD-dependent oxidoreductase [Dehalococcoidales bacterium]